MSDFFAVNYLDAGMGLIFGTAEVKFVCSQQNDFFLARPVKIHPFNRTKLDLTLQLAHKLKFKMADILAYGNSSHDLPLLSAVGTPVVVRPAANLLRVARKLKWEIMGEKK